MKNLGVTLAFTSHLLSPTMSDSEIGGEPAITLLLFERSIIQRIQYWRRNTMVLYNFFLIW